MEPLVSDDLWAAVAPLLPPRKPRPKGGRKPLEDRALLSGILFVLKSGIPWRMLPQELGFGSGVSCWRRLGEWQAAGVWDQLHAEMLRRLHEAGRIDWSRACLDSASVPAKKGRGDGPEPGGPGQAKLRASSCDGPQRRAAGSHSQSSQSS